MSALVHELGSRRDDDPLRWGNDCLPRSIGGLKCSIRRHHQPDDSHLERLAIESRRRLKPISDAAQDAIGDVEISEPVSEKFLNGERFDYAFFPHDDCPQPKPATLDHFQNGTDGKEIRFRIARADFYSKAVSGRGIPLTALGIATGASRNLIQRRPRKNHLNPRYVSAISTAAAPAIQHHMENSFAFSPRAKCSSKSRLLTSAPTVVATSSVVPHSRANAGRRGCVLGR